MSALVLLYTGNAVRNHLLHQKMITYAFASAREDGTLNNVIMNGKAGYLGYSAVKLSYLTDGWISLVGDNVEESSGWKQISTFVLEPGTYTFTGMKGQRENTVALQLHIEDETGSYRYLYQYNEDVTFIIKKAVVATLHVRVFPQVEGVNIKVRPAVYRDE